MPKTGPSIEGAPRRRLRKLVVRLVLSAAVLTLVFFFVDLERVGEGLRQLRLSDWLVALAVFFGLHALSAMKWRYFLSLSDVSIRPRLALSCHAAGMFANMFLPSLIGGDLFRAGLAMPATKQRVAVVLGSVADRFSDMGAIVVIVLLGLAMVPEAGETLGGTLVAVPIFLGALVLGIAGLAITLRILLRPRTLRRLPRGLARKLIEAVRAFRYLRRRPVRALAGFGASVSIQAGYVLVNIFLGHAVGLDMAWQLWFLLFPLGKIAAMLPVSFGGLGVRQAAFAALVAAFVKVEGIEGLAVVQSLVWQSILMGGGLVAGGLWSAAGGAARKTEPAA